MTGFKFTDDQWSALRQDIYSAVLVLKAPARATDSTVIQATKTPKLKLDPIA
jgi:hypothetical protein